MANIDQVQLPDGSQYHIIDDTSGYATTTYVQNQISTINKNTIGLGNVDNTADINKPVSSPQQTALNGKVNNGIVAYVESDTTATKRYEVGDQFILNGVLYTATAIIPVNNSIVIGTNCISSDTLAEQLSDINTELDNKVSKTGDTMSGNLTIDGSDGTTSTVGSSVLIVGNNTASGTEGNSRGSVYIYGASAYYSRIRAGALTAHREINLPDKGGTFAMTSDIPTDFVSKESGGTFSGNVTVNSANGTTSSVGTSYLVLGNSTASGTANNSKGVLEIYGKGSNYATITATNVTANRGFELPNKGGTIALTSDIPSTTSSSTTHGTLYKYGNVRVWQSVESATSITIPNTYTWGSEIASGDRPSYSANIHGCTLDSNGNVTGDISGSLGTNGTMTFRTSNGSTGNYYLRMTCMWIVG